MGFFNRAGKGVVVAISAKGNWRTWRRKSCLLVAAVVLLPGPLFIGGVALTIYEVRVQRELDALEASIRAKGEPVTLEELEAYYPKVPAAENGALVYLKAMEALKAIDDEDTELYSDGDRLKANTYTLETLARVRVRLAEREPVFIVLADAQNFSQFYYPVDLSALQGNVPANEPLRYARKMGNLLWVQGFMALQDRDWDTFTKNQRQLLHFADSLATIPAWQSAIGLAVQRSACELVQRAIATGEAPVALGEPLDPLYARIDIAATIHQCMIGERCRRVAQIDAHCRGAIEPSFEPYLPLRARWMRYGWIPGGKLMELRERRRILRFTTAQIDDHGKPWRDRFANAVARQPYYRDWEFKWAKRTYLSDGTWLEEEMSLGDFITDWINPEMHVWLTEEHLWFMYVDVVYEHLIHMETQLRCVRMALLINGLHKTTGEFPASTEMLGEAAVADPFDGAPLRFKSVEGGFIVYSVGDDLVDHGGMKPSDEGGDVVMEFIRNTRVVPEKDPPRDAGRGWPLDGGGSRARWVSGG